MQWMDCGRCGHQFVSGHYTEAALSIIFSVTGERQTVGNQIEKNRIVSARMIDRVTPFQSVGIWLDIGFGNGSLLFTAEEYGFDVIGVDLRQESVDAMKGLGFQVHCDLVQNLSFNKKVSVVSMMDVLEHIPYPKEVLHYLNENMEENGCLLISMPNTENILWKLMTQQNKNPYYGELEHYHNFSRTRLYSLLEECGFTAVNYGVSERYISCMEIVAIKKSQEQDVQNG